MSINDGFLRVLMFACISFFFLGIPAIALFVVSYQNNQFNQDLYKTVCIISDSHITNDTCSRGRGKLSRKYYECYNLDLLWSYNINNTIYKEFQRVISSSRDYTETNDILHKNYKIGYTYGCYVNNNISPHIYWSLENSYSLWLAAIILISILACIILIHYIIELRLMKSDLSNLIKDNINIS